MDWAQVAVRVLGDTRPSEPEAIYVFTQLPDNQPSVAAAAALAVRQWPALRVLIADEDGTRCPGYGGVEETRAALLAAGVPQENVEEIPFPKEATLIHTLNESEAVVRYCLSAGLRELLVAAPAFHLLRAFSTVVTVALREHPGLKLYGYPGDPLPWAEPAVHSQGSVYGSRYEVLQGEMDRIERYTAKGDICPATQILGYLKQRDGLVC